MKKLIFTICFVVVALSSYAQRAAEFKPFEIELNGGYSFYSAATIGGYARNYNAMTYSVEARYNFQKIPFDLGIRAFATKIPDAYENSHGYGVDLTADYNMLFIGNNIIPFIGFGGGMMFCTDSIYHKDGVWHLMPRIGVELYQHLRIGFNVDIYGSCDTYSTISIGVVFGGSRKK